MDLDRFDIPWRIPCSLELADCRNSELTYITPTIRWASVVNPGDFVELVNPLTFQMMETFAVIFVKKVLLWMVDDNDLANFPPVNTLAELIKWLTDKYGITISEYTPVCVLSLKKPGALDKAYKIFMKPNGPSITGN